MPERVLVTGAAGFAGSHLVDRLAAAGVAVIAWRRGAAARAGADRADAAPAPSSIRWMEVELLQRSAVDAAIAEVRPDAVVHCAGAAHVGRSWDRTEATF